MGTTGRGGAAKKPAPRKRAAAKPATRRKAPAHDGVFGMRQKRPVAAFLGMALDDPALTAVLAVQRSTGLSVFNGELFAIEEKVPSRDAAGVVEEKWVRRPAAGRDGFLAVAERSGVFGGIVGDVVCANDTFEVDWSDSIERGAPFVRHRHAAMVGGGTASEMRAFRGPIIGAWAKGWREDRLQPFFYFAPLKQHGRVFGAPDSGELTWLGAWEYTNAMILKCAMSYVLRILFVITGVLPADEVKNDPTLSREFDIGAAAERVKRAVDVSQVLDIPDAIPVGTPTEVRARLLAALDLATKADPALWPAAKCQMVFAGREPDDLMRIADDIAAGAMAVLATRERKAVMPSQDAPPADDLPVDGGQMPESDDELLQALALARSKAGAAQTEAAYLTESERVDALVGELGRRGVGFDPPAS